MYVKLLWFALPAYLWFTKLRTVLYFVHISYCLFFLFNISAGVSSLGAAAAQDYKLSCVFNIKVFFVILKILFCFVLCDTLSGSVR